MDTSSASQALARHVSAFMLSFGKAQCLESAIACAATPPTERVSTLGLLWGVTQGFARQAGADWHAVTDAVRHVLAGVEEGDVLFRWMLDHRDQEDFAHWSELGEMAADTVGRQHDSMPMLLDLAHHYREAALDREAEGPMRTMPIPGAHLLDEPPPPARRLH